MEHPFRNIKSDSSNVSEVYSRESFARISDLKLTPSLYILMAMGGLYFISEVGVNTILTVFIADLLHLEQNIAISVVMIYRCLSSNITIVIAFLTDNFFGRFHVLIFGTITYMMALIIFSIAAVPAFAMEWLIYVAMIMRGIGVACTQACLVPFANDQMKSPYLFQSKKVLTFYLYLIWGSAVLDLSSALITPFLKDHISCFGRENCYPASFAYCLAQAALGFVIFIQGYKRYIMVKPVMAVSAMAPTIIWYAIKTKIKHRNEKKEDHWLDYAKQKYDPIYIEELKMVINVVLSQMFVFWTLQHQRYTIWTIQATRVVRDIGDIQVYPEQVQGMYPLFIIIFAPIYFFYGRPILTRFLKVPLLQMTLAGFIIAFAFAFAALVSYATEMDDVTLLTRNYSRFTFINGRNSTIDLLGNQKVHLTIQPFSSQNMELDQFNHNEVSFLYKSENEKWSYMNVSFRPGIRDFYFFILEKYQIVELPDFKMMKDASRGGTLLYCICDKDMKGEDLTLYVKSAVSTREYETCRGHFGPSIRMIPGEYYGLKLNNTVVVEDYKLPMNYGNVIVLLIHGDSSSPGVETLKVLKSVEVSFFWMIPQYILLSISSIIFMLAVFVFQYNETPTSCSSLIWSLKHFNSGLDSAAMATSNLFTQQSKVLLLWAVGTFIYVLIFGLLVTHYNYTTANPSSTSTRVRSRIHQSIMYN